MPPKREVVVSGRNRRTAEPIVAPENWKKEAASRLSKPLFVPMLPETDRERTADGVDHAIAAVVEVGRGKP